MTSALQPEPLSAYTSTYDERGWFTGVRSEVTIPKSQAVVYASLSKDLHKVFTPMTVRAGCPQQASGHSRQHISELREYRVQQEVISPFRRLLTGCHFGAPPMMCQLRLLADCQAGQHLPLLSFELFPLQAQWRLDFL